MKTNILILGSNGFIGRNIKEFLEKESATYVVYAPSKKELDITDELAVKEQLKKQFYDVIIHAAVYNPRVGFNRETSTEVEKNLRMFFNFERYSDFYGKMLYFGSGAEFDKSGEISMVNEDDFKTGIPQTDYGFYKYIINKSIQSSKNIYNLRVFGLFGKYENWKSTFISGACCKVLKNLPITIRQNVYFDYLYIDDFCKIVHWFINNSGKYRDYNITSGKRIDLITLADIVIKASVKKLPIYVCKEGYANEYTASNRRLIKELGFFSFTPPEVAIDKLYNWYKKNENDIDIYSLLYH